MESRSLKVWPVAWINRLSSRVTRPHPRLRSFEYSRFLHPFSSRGYAGILQNSNPPFLFLGEEEKRKREFLSAKFILSLRKSSKGFERKIGWSGGKERKARRTPRRRQWAIDMSTFWRAGGARASWRQNWWRCTDREIGEIRERVESPSPLLLPATSGN